jgi:hypothetical protein
MSSRKKKMLITPTKSERVPRVLISRALHVQRHTDAQPFRKIEKLRRHLQRYKQENQKLHKEVINLTERYITNPKNIDAQAIQNCLAQHKLASEILNKMLISLIETHTTMINSIHQVTRQLNY